MLQKKPKLTVKEELEFHNHFHVTIFGSARIKKKDACYKRTFDLAKEIGSRGYEIVTGGGPGLMNAANSGHKAGGKGGGHSIGLPIMLPWETSANKNLDIKKEFKRFSNRLDTFMMLSQVVVVMPGGIGTCLELFYTWQLMQVHHICPTPIILYDQMWQKLLQWIKDEPLKSGYISPKDMDHVYVAKNQAEVMKIIDHCHRVYKKEGSNYCRNYTKYKLK